MNAIRDLLDLVARLEFGNPRGRPEFIGKDGRRYRVTRYGLWHPRSGKVLLWSRCQPEDLKHILAHVGVMTDEPVTRERFVLDTDWRELLEELDRRGIDTAELRRRVPRWKAGFGGPAEDLGGEGGTELKQLAGASGEALEGGFEVSENPTEEDA